MDDLTNTQPGTPSAADLDAAAAEQTIADQTAKSEPEIDDETWQKIAELEKSLTEAMAGLITEMKPVLEQLAKSPTIERFVQLMGESKTLFGDDAQQRCLEMVESAIPKVKEMLADVFPNPFGDDAAQPAVALPVEQPTAAPQLLNVVVDEKYGLRVVDHSSKE